MSKFEVLCVTMHQSDFSKIELMNVRSDIIFANQCDHTSYEEINFEGHVAKMISTQTRGVGKNRNLLLTYADADICLMADDDVIYADDMEERVVKEFDNHPDADVMVFHFESDCPDESKIRYKKTKKWPRFARTPWGAIRIAFRLQSVKKANVWFTTLFGGGCIFPNGEDTMWIKALCKSGLTIYVSRETIGTVSHEESTWFTGYNEKYYYGVGALYAGLKAKPSFLWHLYTVFRTRNNRELTVNNKLSLLKSGENGYKKMQSYNDFIKENDSFLCRR